MFCFCTTKRNFSIFLTVILLTLLLLFFITNIIFASNFKCNSNYIFESSDICNINISVISDLQDKFNKIYSSNEKIVFLTFDDGPTKIATPKVLDILKENDVKATFFVIGYRVNEFPNIVNRAYNEGHFIANHGFSHINSKLYKNKECFLNEILDSDKAISKALNIPNYHSFIFRFPNGSTSKVYSYEKKQSKKYLKEIGYCYIDWNALNGDSIKKYSSSELLNNLKKSCKNKQNLVVLMHDTNDVSKTYTALDESIKYLKQEGYVFKTLDELLK